MLRSNFFIKLKSWEYWPFGILQFPLFFYWFWLAVKSRSLLFFTASNPGIFMGGMFGESKFDVLKLIPSHLIPKTLLIKLPITLSELLSQLRREGLSYPLIFKPDIGERGFMVKKIRNDDDVQAYLNVVPGDFLVQEFVDLPLEYGVFYRRYPNDVQGNVTSIVIKEMLSVTGDGMSTLQELILRKDRAKLQFEKLRNTFSDQLQTVPAAGQCIELVSIGNHALGTKFLDGSALINPELSASFDKISKQISGFYFGRYDLRCASAEDLTNGNVKIMELNGCGAEPAHIYQPGFSIVKAVGILLRHWQDIFQISWQNHQRGVNFIPFREGYATYKKFKSLTR